MALLTVPLSGLHKINRVLEFDTLTVVSISASDDTNSVRARESRSRGLVVDFCARKLVPPSIVTSRSLT